VVRSRLRLKIASKKLSAYLLIVALCIFLIVGLFVAFPLQTAIAQTSTNLANEFVPILHFTNGELFYPTSVDYLIGSSTLKQRDSGGLSSTIVNSNPTPSNLGSFSGSDLFLDNNLATLESIADDYSLKASSLGYYAYVHIANTGTYKVIQYWFLYVYNNGPLNNHQADWEVIEIFLDNSGQPIKALYSQHGAGENTEWVNVEKDGNHPIVYVAQGSHANYFRSYQGKIGMENDIVGNDGKTITSSELQLVILSESGSQPAEQSWLDFAGRWGYWGTDQEVILGMAGPLGPVYNQDGIRWEQPTSYLDSTLNVGSIYFIGALLVANFLIIFLAYALIRGVWKSWGIVKLKRKGGLLARRIIKGRVALGLLIGIIGVGVSIAGFFLPWYTITASSQTGPLAQEGATTLMNIDGVSGVKVNLFLGDSLSDSSSGFKSFASAQMPFAIIIAVGLILLVLDIIAVKNNKKLGNSLIYGIIGGLLPIVIILLLITQLSALPAAPSLMPGQTIPTQVTEMLKTIAASPIGGSTTTIFPIIGETAVNWGLGIGAFLLIIAAILRVIGGLIMRTAPTLKEQQIPPPPPPPPT
jgi:hypothetical protein